MSTTKKHGFYAVLTNGLLCRVICEQNGEKREFTLLKVEARKGAKDTFPQGQTGKNLIFTKKNGIYVLDSKEREMLMISAGESSQPETTAKPSGAIVAVFPIDDPAAARKCLHNGELENMKELDEEHAGATSLIVDRYDHEEDVSVSGEFYALIGRRLH